MSVSAVRKIAQRVAEPAPHAQSSIAVADAVEGSSAPPSPARGLQQHLEANLWAATEGPKVAGRWPLYAALPFWLAVSGLMWAAIIGGVMAIVRHH